MNPIIQKTFDQVRSLFVYLPDKEQFPGKYDDWQSYVKLVEQGQVFKDDCVAEYEEIYTKNGIKKVKNLLVGDMVLSYDFDIKKFTYKPVTAVWDKGELPCVRVGLKNGQWIDISHNHPLWVRSNQSHVHGKKVSSKYEKRLFSDIDLTRYYRRRLPFATVIPYDIHDIDWLTEDLCFVIGHYMAEGWNMKNGSKITTSGHACTKYILPILDKYSIPYTAYTSNYGVPCVRFLESDFKSYLKPILRNSFDITLPKEMFALPKSKLRALFDGYYLGDGHQTVSDIGTIEKVYSTSSEQWASDMQRIGLQLGEPFYIYKQLKHGGVGKQPIFRVTHNPNSHFYKNHGYENLSEIGIARKHIEEIGLVRMFDFTVADTHTFVFKNGTISHQCDGFCLTVAEMLVKNGLSPELVRISLCKTETGEGHLVCIADEFVLDNRQRAIWNWNQIPYIWVSSMKMSEPGIWRTIN